MNAIKLVPVLCAFSLVAGSVLAEIAEAKMRPHRRHVADRHRYEERRERASPRISDFQRHNQYRRDDAPGTGCFSLSYLRPRTCNESQGGDGG
jgi:hypothetical protein